MLEYSGPAVIRLPSSSGDIFSWLLLHFHTGVSVSGFGKILILGADSWSFLFCLGALFLDFWCPLLFFGGCGGCVLPVREFFWDPTRCGHYELWVECISRYWELTLGNGGGLQWWGWDWGSTGGRICLAPSEWGRVWGESTAEGQLQSWGIGFGEDEGEVNICC